MDSNQIATALVTFAEQMGFIAQPAYYIVGSFNLRADDGSSVYSDEAHLWCEDCAKTLLAKALPLLPERERDNHFICITEASGEDSCPHCMSCGETLHGSVSSYAVAEEVDHYHLNPIEPSDNINPRQAVEIAQILYAAPDDQEVLAIGIAALAALRETKGERP